MNGFDRTMEILTENPNITCDELVDKLIEEGFDVNRERILQFLKLVGLEDE